MVKHAAPLMLWGRPNVRLFGFSSLEITNLLDCFSPTPHVKAIVISKASCMMGAYVEFSSLSEASKLGIKAAKPNTTQK